jgi:hypothetical protein
VTNSPTHDFWSADYREDVRLVTDVYERCWQKSKGRLNRWMPGRLSVREFTFYLVLNALERALMGGMLAIVDHDDRFRDPTSGFTLANTAAAFDRLGLLDQADGIRELAKIFPDGTVPCDRRQLDSFLTRASKQPEPDYFGRADALFSQDGWQAVEYRVYRRLARYVRENPREFSAGE